MSDMTVGDILRAKEVQRWHLVKMSQNQSVAEHSWSVAIIADAMVDVLQLPIGSEDWVVTIDAANVMRYAVYHDATEVMTGDIPTPVKQLIKNVCGSDLLDSLEEAASCVPYNEVRKLLYTDNGEPSLEALIVKWADVAEAYQHVSTYCTNQSYRVSLLGQLSDNMRKLVRDITEKTLERLVNTLPPDTIDSSEYMTITAEIGNRISYFSSEIMNNSNFCGSGLVMTAKSIHSRQMDLKLSGGDDA